MADVNHIAAIDTFTSDATDRILSIFENSPNIQGITEIEAARWEALDLAVISLAEGLILQNATGVALDDIGEKLGVYRYEADDDDYRTVLKIRAYSKNNTGTRASLSEIIEAFTGVSTGDYLILQGNDKRIELSIPSLCFDVNTNSEEIVSLLPLVSNYSILTTNVYGDSVFGLTSVSTEGDITNTYNYGTLSSTEDTDNGGELSALVNTYSKGVIS